ncbi:MAG: response regulator transcription factor, partial [Chloroflexi bacterium]|nr:response regulator transcription factor [Chloroflexota bacterium]
ATAQLRILIAESIPLVRLGLRVALQRNDTYVVVAEVESCSAAMQVLRREPVDLLIACVELTDQDGFALVSRARSVAPHVRCLVLSEAEAEDEMYRAMKVGAAGYLSKLVSEDRLLGAVDDILQGCVTVSTEDPVPSLSPGLTLPSVEDRGRDNAPAGHTMITPLSPRELEVVRLIAQGYGNKDIAQELGISDQTVKNHITAILRKLGANDRTAAAIYALQRGWIRLS